MKHNRNSPLLCELNHAFGHVFDHVSINYVIHFIKNRVIILFIPFEMTRVINHVIKDMKLLIVKNIYD